MTLAQLRALFYVYLGTPASDPMYPTPTVNALLNAVAAKYRNELYQLDPAILATTTTLTVDPSDAHLYALPDDFVMALDVRIATSTGTALDVARYEELPFAWGQPKYALTGVDEAAVLHTSTAVPANTDLYLCYNQEEPDLVADGDVPAWMPKDFHDLLAREAAIDAYGLGDEAAPSPRFLAETEDRRALFYLRMGRRASSGLTTRS